MLLLLPAHSFVVAVPNIVHLQSVGKGAMARPSMAATLGRLQAPKSNGAAEATTLRSGDAVNRIGGHTFGMDPEHSKYYNRTEHGTYLIREALNQRTGTLPAGR